MDIESDTDFPKWVRSPAEYSAPPIPPGDRMEKEKVSALRKKKKAKKNPNLRVGNPSRKVIRKC